MRWFGWFRKPLEPVKKDDELNVLLQDMYPGRTFSPPVRVQVYSPPPRGHASRVMSDAQQALERQQRARREAEEEEQRRRDDDSAAAAASSISILTSIADAYSSPSYDTSSSSSPDSFSSDAFSGGTDGGAGGGDSF